MTLPQRRLSFPTDGPPEPDASLEWLVTNGLGGYASAPVHGGLTRRYHGLLIAALPPPTGRLVYATALRTTVVHGGRRFLLDHEDFTALPSGREAGLRHFALEGGLPVWRYEFEGLTLERRVFMPHRRNATCVLFTVIDSQGPTHLECRPWIQIRPIEAGAASEGEPLGAVRVRDRLAIVEAGESLPALRIQLQAGGRFDAGRVGRVHVPLAEEHARGYGDPGWLQTIGDIVLPIGSTGTTSVVLAAESDDSPLWPDVAELLAAERARRESVLAVAAPADAFEAELVLAADQFLIVPVGHDTVTAVPDQAPPPPGAASRTIVAGYHWFTDWGRDTMISLEGLALELGRHGEAAQILRMFARHVRDGLIPNLFPEGARSGLYHTADATLWFVHAIHRYAARTADQQLIADLLPVLEEVITSHREGTRFGIGVDVSDGLLRQGEEGYQLTWMDAKVDGWVVTPRRGKAVEINALWFNALRLLADSFEAHGRPSQAQQCRADAERVYVSFNERFWNRATGWLFDVVDGETGDDPACRPNQVLSISLPHPVLARERWDSVLDAVGERLVTPLGLRSLAPEDPDYRPQYFGDLRRRDAAYHQGTVWAWLIGPWIDAQLRAGQLRDDEIRRALSAFERHLSAAGVGSISEIFDAETPHVPRGCIAQAWSVAEVLRCWRLSRQMSTPAGDLDASAMRARPAHQP
jgi:glycogen debranching enzyme